MTVNTGRARVRLLFALVATLGLGLASGAAAQEDPNLPAVQAVCGRCHGVGQFMDKPRSWARWNDVFQKMTQLGAGGTDAQLEQVTSYFLDHLTTLDVNTASAEEISWVLGVDDSVAQAIISRREKRPFSSVSDLAGTPGVKADRIASLKPRLSF